MKTELEVFCVNTDIFMLTVTAVEIQSVTKKFVAKHWPASEQNLITKFGKFDSQTVSGNFAGSLNK